MRIFLTGATGFIGSRILPALLTQGHQVIGMTRTEAGARSIATAGAEPFLATLEDPAGIARGTETADAVIHTAFDHEFTHFIANCAKDARVIAAIGDALRGSDRPFMITSGAGIGAAGDGRPAREEVFDRNNPNPRVASELALERELERGVNGRVMRLPQVHDTRRQGLLTPYIAIAREKGVVAYAGSGESRLAAAHISDVVALYALAFDKGSAGVRYHAVAEEGIAMRDIAETIARRLDLPTAALGPDELQDHFGWFAPFADHDMAASSDRTRKMMGWTPTGPGLLQSLANLEADA